MQAASCFVQPIFLSKSATKNAPSTLLTSPPPKPAASRNLQVKAASLAFEPLSFNYNSPFSVFPAEACETIGGDACAATMFPETKLNKQQGNNANTKTPTEEVDREYFDYDSEPNSVLRAEECDDLGGEFCDAPFNYRYAVM